MEVSVSAIARIYLSSLRILNRDGVGQDALIDHSTNSRYTDAALRGKRLQPFRHRRWRGKDQFIIVTARQQTNA